MKTTGEPGSPAERSSGATSPERRSILVPFGPFEWLLVGYLVVSGLIHVGLGVTPLWRGDPFTRLHSFRIATGVFSLLLTGQLIHRVPVARYSISLIFIMQIGLFLKLYVIESPLLWSGLTTAERLQRVGEFGFWVIAVLLVLTRPWRVAHYADLPTVQSGASQGAEDERLQ
ncbi:MAG: hypothetical protein ACO4BJ_00685 [Planctomycetota bacterium]